MPLYFHPRNDNLVYIPQNSIYHKVFISWLEPQSWTLRSPILLASTGCHYGAPLPTLCQICWPSFFCLVESTRVLLQQIQRIQNRCLRTPGVFLVYHCCLLQTRYHWLYWFMLYCHDDFLRALLLKSVSHIWLNESDRNWSKMYACHSCDCLPS